MDCNEMLDLISFIGSLATILLFFMYFIGRAWSLKAKSKQIYETIVFIDSIDEIKRISLKSDNKIYSCGNEATVKIQFNQSVNWIKIFQTTETDFKSIPNKSKKVLFERDHMFSGETFFWELDTPEGGQNTWLEFERFDYSRGFIVINYGGLCGNNYIIQNSKPTFKNLMYNIIR